VDNAPTTWDPNHSFPALLIVDCVESKQYQLKYNLAPGLANVGLWVKVGAANTRDPKGATCACTSTTATSRPAGPSSTTAPPRSALSTTASAESVWQAGVAWLVPRIIYLGISRKTSDNTWRAYVSNDGVFWRMFAGPRHTASPSTTST